MPTPPEPRSRDQASTSVSNSGTLLINDASLRELLAGRPVLVTGADGFVGSHLTEKLVELGARVHVLVRATSSGMLHNIAPLRDRIVLCRAELTDKHAVMNALKTVSKTPGEPVIFHLGAQAHVGECWQRPGETIATNVVGTFNLLQSIVDLDLKIHRIDTAGSSEEYGNVLPEVKKHYRFDDAGGLILDETSPVNPLSPYATSKLAADFLTRNFFRAYGVPGVVTRMFNNYGPRQNPRFLTGTIITQALSRDVIHLGYSHAKRDFCFVQDGVMGHIHTALFGEPGEVYVYGFGQTVSVLDWYTLIIRIGREGGYWGAKTLQADSEGRGRLGKSEVEELRVDYSKLQRLTGWRPEYSWEEGLRETVKWYAENRERWIGRVDWL